METACEDDMHDDTERKGLGTPATRAVTIEKLVKSGFAERQKKNLLPTEKGKKLIAVLPNTLTSAKLTAEWEHELKKVENGELDSKTFMENIADFSKSIVSSNAAPKPEYIPLFSDTIRQSGQSLGTCPRCGFPIREEQKGFFCDNKACGFKIWRNSRFWTAKKKPLTTAIVSALLKDGRVAVKGLYSEKTGKKYDATVVLDDNGDGYIDFMLGF